MGLDMYLSKKTEVKNYAYSQDPKDHIEVLVTKGGKKVKIDPTKIETVTEGIGYWRKANAIHAWFVMNVQGGDDDCKEYEVTFEQLENLRDTCESVLHSSHLVDKQIAMNNKFETIKVLHDTKTAEKFLPVQSGFFFGGTEYDEYYVEYLTDTVKIINEALDNDEPGIRCSYYYQSSW